MATITRYFRTDSTTGGDGTEDRTDGATRAYATLNAAIVAEQADLTVTPDILHLICTIAGADTFGGVSLTGYTTGATGYILIECQGSARNNGFSREKSSTGYSARSGNAFSIREDYVRIIGVEFSRTAVGPIIIFNTISGTSDIRLDECLFCQIATGASGEFLLEPVSSTGADISFTNCLFIANDQRGPDFRTLTATIDHCGLIGTGDFGCLPDAGTTITNTWSVSASSEDFWTGGSTPSGSHNASLDNSAATDYTNTVDIVANANEFTTPSIAPDTADMTLLDSLLNTAGTGSEAIDITGASRTGTADIGPFDFAAAAAGAIINQLQSSNLGSDLYNGTLQ